MSGCWMMLSEDCLGESSKASPICGACWKASSTKRRESVKLVYNAKTKEHKFCNKTGCWDTVGKKHAESGFCKHFNVNGACQYYQTSELDPPVQAPPFAMPPVPPRAASQSSAMAPVPPRSASQSAAPLTPDRAKRRLSPRQLDPVLRDVRKCMRGLENIEKTLIALGAEPRRPCADVD